MSDDITGADVAAAESSVSSGSSAASPDAAATTTPTIATPTIPATEPAAIVPAGTSAAVSATDPTKTGPIPFDAHKTALENARQKATAEWDKEYGWAKQVDRQAVQKAVEIAQKFQRDRIGYVQELIRDMQSDPELGPQLKSLAARALAQRSTVPAAPDLTPLQVQMDNGHVASMYTADQIKAMQASWIAQVKQELSPVTKTVETLQAERAALHQAQARDHYVATTYADAVTWPGMDTDANKQAVAEALGQMAIDPNDPLKVSLALNAAYRQVVLPQLQRSERQSVVRALHEQANANTVNPGMTGTKAAKTMDEMSIAEALAHVAATSV